LKKPTCECCERIGAKYGVEEWNPAYAVIDNGRIEAFWDEDGKYHESQTWWTRYYKCSNGHSFSELIHASVPEDFM
jgi:hypothetical protein